MTKQDNIFFLYEKLGYSGQRNKAKDFIAKTCDARVTTVKNHWIQNKEFPLHVEDEKLDTIIVYLQNAIKQQNKVTV